MNFLYWIENQSQILKLDEIERIGLNELLTIGKARNLEFRCRCTGKFDKNNKELCEGHIVKDPGGSIGVLVWNTCHSQFLFLFDGEHGELVSIDESVIEWAEIIGHVLSKESEELIYSDLMESAMASIKKYT
jgi:hypothetical protein